MLKLSGVLQIWITVGAVAMSLSGQGANTRGKAESDLADRIVAYAGGMKPYAKLRNLAFRESSKSVRGLVERETYSRWLLVPRENRARLESEGGRVPPFRKLQVSEPAVMTLNTMTRRNILTLPKRQGPKISLWSRWHRVQRLILLPFLIQDSQVRLKELPRQEKDAPTMSRLKVTWPATHNYKWVDAQNLLVESDTGRIVEVTEITGLSGERRVDYAVTWKRVGGLRFPVAYRLKEGRGGDVRFDLLRTNRALPKDVWTRPTSVIMHVAAPPEPVATGVGRVVRIRLKNQKAEERWDKRLHFCVFDNGKHDQIYVGTNFGGWMYGEFDLSVGGRVVFTGRVKRLLYGGVILAMGDVFDKSAVDLREVRITRIEGESK